MGFQAAPTETHIIRTTGAKRREIRVNLSRVQAGKDPDPILQNDDIVMIPTNVIKAAIKGGGIGIAMGLIYRDSIAVMSPGSTVPEVQLKLTCRCGGTTC